VKPYLWHGNSRRALERLQDIHDALGCWECDEEGKTHVQPGHESVIRMLKYVQELNTYIVNYGEGYRNGERSRPSTKW